MRIVSISRRSKALNALLEPACSEDLILQDADGAQFLLRMLDDFAQEVAATRRNEKLRAYLEECAGETELIPLNEVKRQLGLPSKQKGRRQAQPQGRRRR